METESITHRYFKGAISRRYDIVDEKLKWGYIGDEKFEFIIGRKYQVCHQNKAMKIHSGAVGIYKGLRRSEWECFAILECCRKKFLVKPEALLPWEGEITEEHLKLISPLKKVHLSKDNRCACKCDSSSLANPFKVGLEEFLTIPENSRCTNCNNIAKNKESIG